MSHPSWCFPTPPHDILLTLAQVLDERGLPSQEPGDFGEQDQNVQDVAGGPAFKIGGHQIDACGGVEDTFVVMECKSAKKREKNQFANNYKNLKVQFQA